MWECSDFFIDWTFHWWIFDVVVNNDLLGHADLCPEVQVVVVVDSALSFNINKGRFFWVCDVWDWLISWDNEAAHLSGLFSRRECGFKVGSLTPNLLLFA